jgi:ribosomal protein S18 acetylase RimI-like enzyme
MENLTKRTINCTIAEIQSAEMNSAIDLVARTMAANPIHLAIFKDQSGPSLRKQYKMFEFALTRPHRSIIVAKNDSGIVGVMCYTTSLHCQLKPGQVLKAIPLLLPALGNKLFQVLKWQYVWGKHDYPKPHIHFGPLAVDRQHQGKGYGKILLTHFCNYLDESRQTGYLETDKVENVRLYEKFGFKVISEDGIYGVKNWFMVREI